MKNEKHGYFVISLDFELLWGMLDHENENTYGSNILGAERAVFHILKEFKKYGIHATWAVVGFLTKDSMADCLADAPKETPSYHNGALSPYSYLARYQDDKYHKYFFAKECVNKIAQTAYQEIGSHTYAHYYCREEGQTQRQFEADLKCSVECLLHYTDKVESIVFPRNQRNEKYDQILLENGIYNYRGKEQTWVNRLAGLTGGNILLCRALRFLDSYINVTGSGCFHIKSIKCGSGLNNVRASRFLRPYEPGLRFAEPLKVHRIKAQMRHAAKHNKVYHLWWHPHNFGVYTKENMRMLEDLFIYYKYLHKKYGFQSVNMRELSNIADIQPFDKLVNNRNKNLLKQELIDKCKRIIKNRIPFTLRHALQLYAARHPESRFSECLRQKSLSKDHHDRFYAVLRSLSVNDFDGKTVCELGPGGILANAFFIYQMGGVSSYFIDIDNYAHIENGLSQHDYEDLRLSDKYIKLAELPLYEEGFTWADYLKKINAEYYTDGLNGYKKVPDCSVDFLYSCTVLQHIRKNIFLSSVHEMYRMMKPGAVAYHTVDLKDMMGGGKNHLRYSEEFWNDSIHTRMRCYTNRIQCADMCKIFKRAGFHITSLTRNYFKHAPVKKKLLSEEFKGINKKELYTETFEIVMQKPDK